ncbi:MAG: YciI family protein [Gemmataceae bacterium]
MAKFLFIYRDPTEPQTKPSPEEMQALAGAWYAWMQKFSTAIVPGGDGLKHSGRVVKGGLVTDGPYVEAKEIIVSFTIIEAADYDAAVAIAKECPPGHNIEIREFAGYAG